MNKTHIYSLPSSDLWSLVSFLFSGPIHDASAEDEITRLLDTPGLWCNAVSGEREHFDPCRWLMYAIHKAWIWKVTACICLPTQPQIILPFSYSIHYTYLTNAYSTEFHTRPIWQEKHYALLFFLTLLTSIFSHRYLLLVVRNWAKGRDWSTFTFTPF